MIKRSVFPILLRNQTVLVKSILSGAKNEAPAKPLPTMSILAPFILDNVNWTWSTLRMMILIFGAQKIPEVKNVYLVAKPDTIVVFLIATATLALN